MNIAPKSRFIHSLRAERGDIVRVCGEAVDNSFDAAATTVNIEIGADIKFTDDGAGILADNIPALFTYGDHVQLKTTSLGRFGVGIFVQAISAADLMQVRTISIDGCYLAQVNWRSVIRDGFEVEDPARLPVVVGAPTGTVITLSVLRKLKAWSIEKVIDDLAQRFYPAIADNRVISVNDIQVPLLAEPAMTDVVDRRFEFANGRGATLHAGLLAKPSSMNRVHVAYGHRVIRPASTYGCGAYTGLTNMFARVQLSGTQWALTTFKDDIYDEDQRTELEDAIEEAITPILEKCGTASMEARVAAIGDLMNEMLPADMAAARPHRRKQDDPTGKGRGDKKHGAVDDDKAEVGRGPARVNRPQKDRLLITWEGKNKDHGIGWFEPGRTNRVHMSPDNPKIKELFQHRDDKFIALALMIIAVLLFEHGRAGTNPQLDLLAFGVRVAEHLTRNTIPAFKTA